MLHNLYINNFAFGQNQYHYSANIANIPIIYKIFTLYNNSML